MKLQIRFEGSLAPKISIQVNAQSNKTQLDTDNIQVQVDTSNETFYAHDPTGMIELEVLMRPA